MWFYEHANHAMLPGLKVVIVVEEYLYSAIKTEVTICLCHT